MRGSIASRQFADGTGSSLPSVSRTLSSATGISSGYPDGRVSFTVYGPIDAPHGGMVVFKD